MIIFAKVVKKALLAISILLFTGWGLSAQWDKDVFSWRGRNALSDGKYAKAIENFNILTRLDSTDYWSFFWRGIAKYNLGDIRGAQRDFNSSLRINPVFTNGYHYRAITYSRSGDYDSALSDLEKAISLRPGFIGLYYSRGVTYFLARRFDDAVLDFDRFIRKEPQDASAYLNRGACHLFLGDTLKAMTDYNKAVALDRFESESYIRRGSLQAMRGDAAAAMEDMNKAIDLDSTSTLARFNRAILFYEKKEYKSAMADFDAILALEPGNALTLYNRSLIYAQVGEWEKAIEDMDRVLSINPDNVLAHFNRAAFFVETGRYKAALEDYDSAIERYPDFAKAYLNRSYVNNLLGRKRQSRADYETAQRKIREYREKGGSGALADTSAKFNTLLALDAEFARKDFNDEMLQHRVVDINLKPLYRIRTGASGQGAGILSGRYENALLDRFLSEGSVPLSIGGEELPDGEKLTAGDEGDAARTAFVRGLLQIREKQFSKALEYFNRAVALADSQTEQNRYSHWYKALYLMNRATLKAEMIDFIASIEKNVQTISMDDQGNTRARLSDSRSHQYDYSDALADLNEAIALLPDLAYLYYNLGNLQCLSSDLVDAVSSYGKAVERYPGMGEAYYNRGLVLIFLKDREKGCIDLSRAGELGVAEAYRVISKYCKDEKD